MKKRWALVTAKADQDPCRDSPRSLEAGSAGNVLTQVNAVLRNDFQQHEQASCSSSVGVPRFARKRLAIDPGVLE